MMSKHTLWRLPLIVILTAGLLVLTDVWAARQADALSQMDLLAEVRHELVEAYVDEPDQTKMIESAVQGMVDALRDPYTVYVPAEQLEQFEDRLTGSFTGIGAEIDVQDGRPRIVTPLESSPAWKAGIMAGDLILKVDGQTTLDESLMQVIKRIKGEAGTDVTLTVRRETGEELDITITRAQITVHTVRGARRRVDQSFDYMLDPVNKIGYARVTQFTEPTAGELRSALEQLNEQGARGFILDLRFDPGGLLESAVQISDMFLEDGQRIVSTKGRAWPEQVFDATDQTLMPDIPMVVLANEGSASASEVVTGALSDNGRALFVGTRTFGKGSVQQVRGLDTGPGALKFTGAYYYLPNGRNIHRKPDAEVWGVDPDEGAYVPMTYKQYDQMIQVRRNSDTIRPENGHNEGAAVTPDWINDQLKDPQLAAALTAVLGKLDTGDWPTVGQSNAQELVKQREHELLERRRSLLLEELHKVEAKLADGDESEAEATAPGTIRLPAVREPSLDPDQGPGHQLAIPEIVPEETNAPGEQPTPESQPELVPDIEADPIEEPATQPEPAAQP